MSAKTIKIQMITASQTGEGLYSAITGNQNGCHGGLRSVVTETQSGCHGGQPSNKTGNQSGCHGGQPSNKTGNQNGCHGGQPSNRNETKKSELSVENESLSRKHPVHTSVVTKHNQTEIVFVTVCAKDRKKIFACDEAHRIITEIWQKSGKWVVGRYVLMPDHIHFFCAPTEWNGVSLKHWIGYWKSMVSKCWHSVGEHPIWQTDFWDRQLRGRESYSSKWEYVKNNPVRAGLVKNVNDWPYQGELNVLHWHD